MFNKKFTKTSLTALAVTSALAVSSGANAAITAFSDDFQSYTPTSTFAPSWVAFSDNGGFPGGYFIPAPSTNGPQISSLADDGNGNQYLNFYANYDNLNVHNRATCNPCSPNLQESISIFHEMSFTSADTIGGDTWLLDFDYASNPAGPVTGNTQVSAFIRVFDPVFNLLEEQTFDTASALATFQSGQLSLTLDPNWSNGVVQIGFNNLVGNYDGSGRFYDNVNFAQAPAVPVPAAVWLFGSGLLGLVGVARRRKA
jgi:hypothetical protein